jgi:hypothetical protein
METARREVVSTVIRWWMILWSTMNCSSSTPAAQPGLSFTPGHHAARHRRGISQSGPPRLRKDREDFKCRLTLKGNVN